MSCNCTMSIGVIGDGCAECQPETWLDILKIELEESEKEAKELRQQIQILEEKIQHKEGK